MDDLTEVSRGDFVCHAWAPDTLWLVTDFQVELHDISRGRGPVPQYVAGETFVSLVYAFGDHIPAWLCEEIFKYGDRQDQALLRELTPANPMLVIAHIAAGGDRV